MEFTYRDYTVAWICALPLELGAAKSVLDELHPCLPQANSDHNNYTLGKISGHNVVVACLPSGVYGKVSASTVVSQLLSTFPEIRFGLMVGIGGGVPSTGVDIRLGDVVISKPVGHSGGVVQYDYGKTPRDGKFRHNGSLNKPRPVLLTAISQMESDSISRRCQVRDILNAVQAKCESRQQYIQPSNDWLFRATYDHPDGTPDCSTCDQNQLVDRDPRETSMPDFHYGLIGSGDQVMKNAKIRDSIGEQWNLLCFEMEAAGFMDQLQPLVIRGICDYCDSHKNKNWQEYAALAAAAYAKVLLSVISGPPMISVDIKLREYYEMANRLKIKRLSGDFLDMEQCYINLSIIELLHKNQDTKSRSEPPSSGFSLLNRLKLTADTPESEVTLPDLFHDRKLPDGQMIQPRRILIRGRAGVGKTTLCKKIVHDFYHQQILLSQDNVIITSRPYAVNISGLAPFDLELETVGFHPNQVQTYLAKTVKDPDITDQIHSFIRSHWLIEGLVRIPIQLDALCYSWNKNNFHSDALPQTMTEIYQVIESRLWKKDILNLEKRNNAGRLSETVVQNLRTRVQIQSLVETEMKFLECLAFTGLYSGIIEFHQGHRDWLYEQPQFCQMSDDVLDRLSFLRTSDTSDHDKSYHFLHLTFQEFFAAQYFVRCWESDSSEPLLCLKRDYLKGKDTMKISPDNFLREEKYAGRYDVFWRFVTGLLRNIDEEQVSSFLQKIESEPQDLLGPAHQRLLMHCFSEIPQPEESELSGSRSNIFLRRLREKMELGCVQWSEYEEKFLDKMHLCSETEFPEHVLYKLLEENFLHRRSSHREKILIALAHRWHMSPKLMDITANFLDDGDSGVRRAAVDALRKQSSWPPEILQAVTYRLDDNDPGVRVAAVEALGTQSPWPPEILKAVTCRLDNENWRIRWAAVKALGKQSPWPPEILQIVTSRLDDDDSRVRRAAVETLGTQSSWPLEILEAITCRLDDIDSRVRQVAFETLCTQSPWPLEILKMVTSRLDDNDSHVRRAVVQALGTQSPWSPGIFEAVTCRLDDNDGDVRWAVVQALGKQSPWPPEILEAVTCRLENENWRARWAAVKALGTRSQWSPGIFEAVTCRLDDNHPSVRAAAVEALGTQSPWPPGNLEAVICQLDDNNWHVRRAAVEALGTQSPWLPGIFEAVTCRLNDEDWAVVRAALKALATQSPWSPGIFEAVTCLLDDNDSGVRAAAVEALGTQSPWSPEIFEAVMCRLDDNESLVQRAAVQALGTQSPWSAGIFEAVTCQLDNDDEFVRWAVVEALGTQCPWPPEILEAVTYRLDNDDGGVRWAAVQALGTQSPWPPRVLEAIMCRLSDRDRAVMTDIEALLWKHKDFISPFFSLHADAVSGLCKIWAQRSIHETFVCYMRDGDVYFETSDGRRRMPLSKRKAQLLKQTLWVATFKSPILHLVYRGRNPFSGLRN